MSITSYDDFVDVGIENKGLRSASAVEYDFIPSDDSLLKNDGFCV